MAEFQGQQIPDQDYGALANDWVVQLLNYLGYEWPTTNTGQLDAWAAEWAEVPSRIQSAIDEIGAAHRHVMTNNSGDGVDAFNDFMRSVDGPGVALESVANAAPMISGAYSAVSLLVTGLKAAVIAEILLDAIQIGMAIFTGGVSAAGSLLLKQGAGAAIDLMIDQVINEILGGWRCLANPQRPRAASPGRSPSTSIFPTSRRRRASHRRRGGTVTVSQRPRLPSVVLRPRAPMVMTADPVQSRNPLPRRSPSPEAPVGD